MFRSVSINLPSGLACNTVFLGVLAPNRFLDMLNKPEKRVARFVGPAFVSFFYMYYFGRYSFEMALLVSLPYSDGRLVFHHPKCLSMFMSTVSFFAQLDCRIFA